MVKRYCLLTWVALCFLVILSPTNSPSPPSPSSEMVFSGLPFDPIQERIAAARADAKYVYLTFDDGPSKNTGAILDLLDSYGIKATFFVIGDSIRYFPQSDAILQRMIQEGHYIGLHSMNHISRELYFEPGSELAFLRQMEETRELVRQATGGFESSLCRPPYGSFGMFSDLHVDLILDSDFFIWDWNADSHDWQAETVADILANIKYDLSYAEDPDRAVTLFHEHDIVLEALPAVIEYFLEMGYEFLPYHPASHFPLNLLHHPDL